MVLTLFPRIRTGYILQPPSPKQPNACSLLASSSKGLATCSGCTCPCKFSLWEVTRIREMRASGTASDNTTFASSRFTGATNHGSLGAAVSSASDYLAFSKSEMAAARGELACSMTGDSPTNRQMPENAPLMFSSPTGTGKQLRHN